MLNVLKIKMGVKFPMISRLGAAGVRKGRFRRPKIQFSSKLANFAAKIGTDLTLIFYINVFLCDS